jgi:hypothetical protein
VRAFDGPRWFRTAVIQQLRFVNQAWSGVRIGGHSRQQCRHFDHAKYRYHTEADFDRTIEVNLSRPFCACRRRRPRCGANNGDASSIFCQAQRVVRARLARRMDVVGGPSAISPRRDFLAIEWKQDQAACKRSIRKTARSRIVAWLYDQLQHVQTLFLAAGPRQRPEAVSDPTKNNGDETNNTI